jgi:HD-GYP domain-containing protein (c-di-GMP phosphodiesterase class II)
MSSELATVSLAQLSAGAILNSPIFDSSTPATKLLGRGVEITPVFLEKLSARGVHRVVVDKRDLAVMQSGIPQGTRQTATDHEYATSQLVTERSAALEEQITASELTADVQPAAEQRIERLDPPRAELYDREQLNEAVQQREQQISYTENLFLSMLQGAATETDEIADVCRQSLKSIVADKDMFLCLGLNPYDANYPARHSLHVSSVALSIGVALGLDDQSLADLGTGCLIHDVGMIKLEPGLYKSKRRLTMKELSRLSDHPVLTLDALACPGVRLSRISRIVAYQIHERCNGSGYPRRRTADEIHPLAKIAGVADAYIGLVSNRAHRPGLMPYYAITKLLESIPQGLFDAKAVRGLLNAVSLFPIGSFVKLSNQRIGRVVRSTGESYMTPMIELWNAEHRQFEAEVIDLRRERDLKIVAPSATC